MITVTDTVFQLDTRTTSYLVRAEGGLLQQLYYGPKIKVCDTGPLLTKNAAGYGSEVVYRPETAPLSLDSLPLDLSPQNKGDFRRMPPAGAQWCALAYWCRLVRRGDKRHRLVPHKCFKLLRCQHFKNLSFITARFHLGKAATGDR